MCRFYRNDTIYSDENGIEKFIKKNQKKVLTWGKPCDNIITVAALMSAREQQEQ